MMSTLIRNDSFLWPNVLMHTDISYVMLSSAWLVDISHWKHFFWSFQRGFPCCEAKLRMWVHFWVCLCEEWTLKRRGAAQFLSWGYTGYFLNSSIPTDFQKFEYMQVAIKVFCNQIASYYGFLNKQQQQKSNVCNKHFSNTMKSSDTTDLLHELNIWRKADLSYVHLHTLDEQTDLWQCCASRTIQPSLALYVTYYDSCAVVLLWLN